MYTSKNETKKNEYLHIVENSLLQIFTYSGTIYVLFSLLYTVYGLSKLVKPQVDPNYIH